MSYLQQLISNSVLITALIGWFAAQVPVSYTHLRAHETDSYLVCRLLLEKKKKTKGSNGGQ